jgi:hypothetical protein
MNTHLQSVRRGAGAKSFGIKKGRRQVFRSPSQDSPAVSHPACPVNVKQFNRYPAIGLYTNVPKLNKKAAAIHHYSKGVRDWVNVGLPVELGPA